MISAPKTVTLTCDGCGTSFSRPLKLHKQAVRKGAKVFHCSKRCYKKPEPKPCSRCGALTLNPKFCSRSCAAKVNNSSHPKRVAFRVKRTCTLCTNEYVCANGHLSKRYCQACLETRETRKVSADLTIGYYLNGRAVRGRHPSWVRAQVRELNRRSNSHLLALPCHACGYAKHVELAHIKSISSFPKSALITEVNHPDNVVQLCRNCHWEFDHHLITLDLGRTARVRSGN